MNGHQDHKEFVFAHLVNSTPTLSSCIRLIVQLNLYGFWSIRSKCDNVCTHKTPFQKLYSLPKPSKATLENVSGPMEPWKRGKNTHIIHSPGCTFPTKVIRLSELGDRRSCHITDTHIRCIRPTLNKVFDWNQTNLIQKTGVNWWHWYKTHTILLYFVNLLFSQN